jgi:hypothetical protein
LYNEYSILGKGGGKMKWPGMEIIMDLEGI